FINENDARSIFLALFEKVADAAGAHTYKHFDKVRSGNGEERNVRFACDCTGQQGLACARGPDEQNALGNAPTELLEFLRILKKLDNFLEFFLRFIGSGYIFEGGLLLLGREEARAGLSKAQCLIASGLHLAHQEQTETDKQEQRSSVKQDQNPIAAAN